MRPISPNAVPTIHPVPMNDLRKILVYHPGAIGDVMLATPVAVTLKHNFPEASLMYCTHPSLIELLEMCAAVDRCLPMYRQESFAVQRGKLRTAFADLIVDLSGSHRSKLLTMWCGAKVVHYRKQSAHGLPRLHAVENFLSTLKPLSLRRPDRLFPTVVPGEAQSQAVTSLLEHAGASGKVLIGLVPGVGRLRPHRGWFEDGWISLAGSVLSLGHTFAALIGGEDESALCQRIAAAAGDRCLSLAGKLSLAQTAALLKSCRLVVSADTGPAHIAVAVGTPVVGLYGPTFPARSGPYGYDHLLVDDSHQCRCHKLKCCRVTNQPGPGQCMLKITPEQVLGKIVAVLERGD